MEKIPIAVIDKEEDNIRMVIEILKNLSSSEVVHAGTKLKDLEIILQKKYPALVILGPSYTIEDVEKILRFYSRDLLFVKVILLVKEVSACLLMNAIKFNLHEVLKFPFTHKEIEESIRRAEETSKEMSAENPGLFLEDEKKKHQEQNRNKKIMVFSAKGGSGKSFIATNLAVDLINQSKKRIILFDLNYQFGDAAIMLNLFPKHTIYDIMEVIDRMDSEMLDSFMTVHCSGVKVLPGPVEPSQGDAISNEATLKIMETLSKISDFIIIDSPSVFSENVLLLIEKTDFLCIVASMDVPSIKNLKISLQVLEQLRFSPEKIFVILNRANSGVGITADEIEKTIHRRIDIFIPSDKIVPITINKGTPVVMEAPKSSVSKNINKLTKLIMTSETKRQKLVLSKQ